MKIVKVTSIVVAGSIATFASFLAVDMSSQNGKVARAETPAAATEVIAHEVLNRRESGSTKLSLIVEVQLVDERLPYESELRELSEHLVASETAYERKSLTFYLPGMKHGEGAFATAHHDPELQVFLRPYTLSDYPEYAKFAY